MDSGVFNAVCAGLVGAIVLLCAATLFSSAKAATARAALPPPAAAGAAAAAPPASAPAPPGAAPVAAAAAAAAAPAAAAATAASPAPPPAPPAQPPPVLRIFYGSQTNTAAGLAGALGKAAAQRLPHLSPSVHDMQALAPAASGAPSPLLAALLARPSLALFLTATYGEGDPPDNAAAFFAWLRSEARTPSQLARLRFAVFGLGNRQYEQYNRAGKELNARLAALGAARAYAHGEGDDDGDLEGDFEQWREGGLWEALRSAGAAAAAEAGCSSSGAAGAAGAGAGAGAGAEAEAGGLPALPFKATFIPAPPAAQQQQQRGSAFCVARSAAELAALAPRADPRGRHFFTALPLPCLRNAELRARPAPGASTRHIELALPQPAAYQAAGNCLVCPENDPVLVAAVAARLGLELDAWFVLEEEEQEGEGEKGRPAGGEAPTLLPFPTPATVGAALACFFDLGASPKRSLALALAPYATAREDSEALARLGGSEGAGARAAWAALVSGSAASASAATPGAPCAPPWGLLQLLNAFPSLRPPLAALAAALPLLAPRAYTIASSPARHPRALALAVSVLRSPAGLQGVCSGYLSRAVAGESVVRALLRPSAFRLPQAREAPVIMVGPGTGIAPMRALLQERSAAWDGGGGGGGAARPRTVLFFGCRARDEDYIYADELAAALREGVLTDLHVAFSREGAEKVYVQHLLAGAGAEVWALLAGEGGASVYVCGATGMGASVMAAFQEIARVHGKVADGAAYVKGLQAAGRYVQELWSA